MLHTTVNRDRLFALFQDMVDIYSPSGKEEELGLYLEEHLASLDLRVNRQEVDENRFNLFVTAGQDRPDVLFMGHIDTVPAFDIDQCEFQRVDGVCHGLGTADMKSGCAALIEAFASAAESGCLPHNVALALVVGEEETGDGTEALLKLHRFRDALVAEPTGLVPCLEHYGYVEMNVCALGARRHAAVSGQDTNAIRAMLRFLLRLEDHVETGTDGIVLNIRDLHSSESGFAVPDRCAAAIDLHLPPGVLAADVAADMESFVKQELGAGAALASRCEVDFPTLANGYRTDDGNVLSGALQQIYGELDHPWNPGAFKSHSDANLLRDAGCSPIILGPGQLTKAHTRDESVESEQVAHAAEIYLRLLETLSTLAPK